MSSQSPSPKKERVPLSYYEDENLTDLPEYNRPVRKPRVGRRGQYKGRVGISELAQVVGSRNNRNIKRSSNFMPGQFDIWNASETGGNNRYWGGYQDVDDDGLAHEYVIRRGGEDGPLIAVNGYTTGKSDWIARRAFYEHYPTRAERKGKSAKSYMRDEYYVPTYDAYGDITEWAITPGSEQDKYREYTQYNRYIPKKLSAYQAFQKYIGNPAFDKYLKSENIDKKDYMKVNGGIGAISRIMSNLYGIMVKGPIIAKLHDGDVYEELEKEFKESRPSLSKSTTYDADFEKYIFNRKEVKAMVNDYTRRLLDNHETSIKIAVKELNEMHET